VGSWARCIHVPYTVGSTGGTNNRLDGLTIVLTTYYRGVYTQCKDNTRTHNWIVGSWVVTRRATGEVIGEFFDPRTVARFNPETCIIETALAYLGRINRELRNT
jgi:hypothetical protein